MAETTGKSCCGDNKCVEGATFSTTEVKTDGVICNCGEGWSCILTKTEGPDAGKVFLKCGEGCSCEIGSSTTGKCTITKGMTGASCKCGEGWSCEIIKTEGPNVGKAFAECGDGGCVTVA